MSHEILAAKLRQLDDRVARLHSRVRLGETEDRARLRREIAALERECARTRLLLGDDVRRSKAAVAAVLAESYEQIGQTLSEAAGRLAALEQARPDPQTVAEDKILLSEYALDLAQGVAEEALLLSLQAIDAQRTLEEKEGSAL